MIEDHWPLLLAIYLPVVINMVRVLSQPDQEESKPVQELRSPTDLGLYD